MSSAPASIRLAALVLLVLTAGAPRAGVVGSGLRNVTVTSGLAAQVESLGRAGDDVAWVAWTVPAVLGDRGMCCFADTSRGEFTRAGGWSGAALCRLERFGNGWIEGSSDDMPADTEARVLLRLDGGRIETLRVYSAACPVDAGKLPVYLLDGVTPRESVALLRRYAEDDSRDKLAEQSIMAVAHHAAPEALSALEDWTARTAPRERRERAAFWLGAARGTPGFERLAWMLEHDPDDDVREKVVFAISISPAPGTTELLIATARRNPNAKLRSQALFWLAQEAGEKTTATLRDALDDDPDAEVRKQAVFAVSQLPKNESVPLLIDLAENHRRPEVREAALFWLGQSGDPRALDLIERILSR